MRSDRPRDRVDALQELFTSHLRTRLILRDVMRAEHEILTRIVDALQAIPERLHEQLVNECVERASSTLVSDPES